MSDTNNNFEDLKKLLKLKRHEIPPPGYFNHFSGDVISRIRTGEAGGSASFIERLQGESPFFSTLLHIFSAKPGVIGGMATGLCLLLLISVVLADRSEPGSAEGTAAMAQVETTQSAPEASPTLASLQPAANGGISVSTNPVTSLQPVATLFGSQQNPLFQPVGFMPANNQ